MTSSDSDVFQVIEDDLKSYHFDGFRFGSSITILSALVLGSTLPKKRHFQPFWSTGSYSLFGVTDLSLTNSQYGANSSIYIHTSMHDQPIPRFALKKAFVLKGHYQLATELD